MEDATRPEVIDGATNDDAEASVGATDSVVKVPSENELVSIGPTGVVMDVALKLANGGRVLKVGPLKGAVLGPGGEPLPLAGVAAESSPDDAVPDKTVEPAAVDDTALVDELIEHPAAAASAPESSFKVSWVYPSGSDPLYTTASTPTGEMAKSVF